MVNKFKVLIMVPCDDYIKEKLKNKFKEDYEFVFKENKKNVTDDQLQEAQIIIGEPEQEQLSKAVNLKWLQLTWAGADRYTQMADLGNFPENVVLTNSSGAFGVTISEYVVGAIITQYHKFNQYYENQKAHIWKELIGAESIINKNVLILGTGDIGKNIAKRLKAFGTNIIGINRNAKNKDRYSDFDEIHSIKEIDTILPIADIVIGCLPQTKETIGLFNKVRLQKIKKDALIVNVGRGSLIVSDDLINIMYKGHLRGAILDVTEIEPLPENSKFWDIENVIITPHISGPSFGEDKYTTDCIWDICIENLDRYIKGYELNNIVDINIGY